MSENQQPTILYQKTIHEFFKTSPPSFVSTSLDLDSVLKSGNQKNLKLFIEKNSLDPVIAERTLNQILKNRELEFEHEILEKLLR